MNPFQEKKKSRKIASTAGLVKKISDMEVGAVIDTKYDSIFNAVRVAPMLQQITKARKHGLMGREYQCKSSGGTVWIKRLS